jgi:hypothetical protein
MQLITPASNQNPKGVCVKTEISLPALCGGQKEENGARDSGY